MSKTHYRAIVIDAFSRNVYETMIPRNNSLSALQAILGGNIEVAHRTGAGDIIFVDEGGFNRSPRDFFYFQGAHQPFAGSGVVVSDEEYEDVNTTVEAIKARVRFADINDLIRQNAA